MKGRVCWQDTQIALLLPHLGIFSCIFIILYHICFPLSTRKQEFFVFFQSKEQYQTENSAGNYFSDPNSQHEIGDGTLKPVDIGEDKGNDQRIGDNGRQRGKDPVDSKFWHRRQSFFGAADGSAAHPPDHTGAESAEQRCEGTENNIERQAAGQHIAEDTAHKKTGHSGRRKKR